MYGWQTKSWRNSTEKRTVDKERREITQQYESGALVFAGSTEVTPMCRCRSFDLPHDPGKHSHLPFGDLDWRTERERRGTRVFQERIR